MRRMHERGKGKVKKESESEVFFDLLGRGDRIHLGGTSYMDLPRKTEKKCFFRMTPTTLTIYSVYKEGRNKLYFALISFQPPPPPGEVDSTTA
jgi:hypothetical protein